MANFWLKLKIWTKLIAVVLAVIYIVLFAVYNSENSATLWFFFGAGRQVTTTVLKLVLIAFLSGVVVTLLIRTTVRTVSQIRELRERQAAEKQARDVEDLKTRAAMLREKRAGEGTSGDAAAR